MPAARAKQAVADELGGPLRRYPRARGATAETAEPARRRGRRSGERPRPSARRAAAARAAAEEVAAEVVRVGDVRAALAEPLRPEALGELAEKVVQELGETGQIGSVARNLGDALAQVTRGAQWPVQKLFALVLLPTLAAMSARKTKAFGVILTATKFLWAPEDWPDPDKDRATVLTALVSDHFLDGRDLLTGVWLLVKLKLPCFAEFDDFFDLICDRIQALRLYCAQASHDQQCDVVRRLIRLAKTGDRQQRRSKFSSAAQLIERFGLDRKAFPEVARHKLACWLCYVVHRVPLSIAEDYTGGDAQLLALCVSQLARAGSTTSAAALYRRHEHSLRDLLLPDVYSSIREDLATAVPVLDEFRPSMPQALALPLGEDSVVLVENAESAENAAACLRGAPVVGIDLEWGALGDWLEPTLALMQLATPDRVFLVDLAPEFMKEPVAALLRILFGAQTPLLLGFSFQNDLRELKRSPWAGLCDDPQGLCDLQELSGRPQQGLARLVEQTLGTKFCKAEQRSYWHRRPLRAAQRHYAALDAFVLLQVASELSSVPLSEPQRLATRLRGQLCTRHTAREGRRSPA